MIPLNRGFVLILCFISAFIFASFMEYWLHRLMHLFPKTFRFHVNHHKKNEGQGVFGEFKDYVIGTSAIISMMFLISRDLGLSWLLGSVSYAAFAAYAHQLQHENPIACFWMKMPVHYVHHNYNQWHHNFGLGVDWWDRVFGTYKPTEWLTEKEQQFSEKGNWEIKWF
jgi:sterol desaturase/sphingolipid hydroxylase (fatty acid hydroxylase superfamily)